MEEKKLHSLIVSLLKIAEEANEPFKYNTVIAELLKVEGFENVVIKNHKDSPVIAYVNAQGGITMLDND